VNYRVCYTLEAKEDLKRLFTFLDEQDPQAAKHTRKTVAASIQLLQQFVQVMQIITQTGRNATDINFTTAFDLSAGTIRQNSIALTNSRVVASSLTFTNLSRTGTPGAMRIQFTLAHVNPSGRNEYDYSKTFYATSTLRY